MTAIANLSGETSPSAYGAYEQYNSVTAHAGDASLFGAKSVIRIRFYNQNGEGINATFEVERSDPDDVSLLLPLDPQNNNQYRVTVEEVV